MNRSLDHARLLVAKAAEDQYVLERLIDDVNAPGAAIGFHAQQAVEKLLKAVLTSRSVRYGRTHDLGQLLDLIDQQGITAPPQADKLPRLTPYAAEFRYDQLPPEAEDSRPFDYSWLVDCVRQVRDWVQTVLGCAES